MMKKRQLNLLIAGLFILLLISSVTTATVTFEDEIDDVYYYINRSSFREDSHEPADVPEIDIVSVSCEVSTVGTTVLLNISGTFAEEFGDDYYSYIIWIYPDSEETECYNFNLKTDTDTDSWESYFSTYEHTYSINEGTLSIFFEEMFLDESTVGFKVSTIHTDADEGADRDWYPDGLEKQTGLDTSSDTDDTSDTSDDNSNSDTDDSSDEKPASDTPGFEIFGLLIAFVLVVIFVRRR
jgi:hypothetical protein